MRFRSVLGVAAVAALTLVGTTGVVPAASQPTETVTCGQNVNHSLVVANNIGPCTGDGLVITTSGITVDLGGHTVTGNNRNNRTPAEQVGVHLMNASNVTVRNGTIANFDAGVAVEGGGSNTIQSLYVHDNINHSATTGTFNQCNFGDGIVLDSSSNNRVTLNRAVYNGPFAGITLLDNSDDNVVTRNQAVNQTVSNVNPAFVSPDNPEGLGPCGPFTEAGTVGRPHQDIGIRIEGPGADRNRVDSNQVVGNQLDGITIHGYICHPPGGRPSQPNNGGNVISNNSVQRNGFAAPNETQDGIAILSQGPATVVCVAFGNSILGNISVGNARHGIFLGGRGSHDNNVSNNVVRNNGFGCTGPTFSPSGQPSCGPGDGIFVTGPGNATSSCGPGTLVRPCPGAINNRFVGNTGSGNAEHDGHDANPNCDNNLWQGNRFGTVNQACVAANGGTGTVR